MNLLPHLLLVGQQFPLHPTHSGSFCTNKMTHFGCLFVHVQLGTLLLLNQFHSISTGNCYYLIIIHLNILMGLYLFCGVRGSCKPVARICQQIIAKIARGENMSVTVRARTWDLPSGKRQQEPEFLLLRFIFLLPTGRQSSKG